MKYTQIIPGSKIPEHIIDCLNEQPARSGMYNWIFAHKGEINVWDDVKDRLEDFDVVQVNMSPIDMPIIPEIRRRLGENSKTKLVLNNDYVCEYWGKWGLDHLRYDQIQRMGDMVFGTEPHQVSNMINGSFCIPHPTNTKILKHLGVDKQLKENSVAFIYHWWAGQSHLASRTLRIVQEKYGLKKTKMFGYQPKPGTDEMKTYNKFMFNEVSPLEQFPDFIQTLQKEKAIFDPNPYHTYGRNGVEAACLGIPVVGSNRVLSYNELFPDLVCDPFDHNEIMRKFKIIFECPEIMKSILKVAYEKVEMFNYENSVKKYEDALKIAVDRGGHKWYQKQ